jgi:mannose-1-phosphate guanylyltransferase
MKAIILAAGRGTRLRPLTHAVPKPMLPVLNKPVMEFLVELLGRHGIRQIAVNTSYLPDEIEGYFRDGARFGVEMAYSFEGYTAIDGRIVDAPVGSAGALKKIQERSGFFDETFVALCGDAIIDVDLTELVRFHRQRRAVATLALLEVPRDRVSSYGVAVTDGDGRILEFQEKPAAAAAKSTTVNTGVYVFEPEVIERIPSGSSYDIGGELFPGLVGEGAPLYGVRLPFQWLDIGKVADYYRAIQMALRGQIRGVRAPGTQLAPGIWAGLDARVDLGRCRVEPPVYLGGNSTLEPGCTLIGPAAIGQGCSVGSGAHVERSVLFDHVRVGSCALVRELIVGNGYCVDPAGTAIDLAQCDLGWVIGDARSPEAPRRREQLQLEECLRGRSQIPPWQYAEEARVA